MIFLKEHLRKRNYEWAVARNHSKENNEPDRRIFDRFNGYQVLFLINYFGRSVGNLSFTEGIKLEELISTSLPLETKSELSVFNWLRGVYLYYSN
jgi:hypothetical protein